MTQHFPLMIPSAKDSGERLAVHAPYDNALIADVACADEAAVEQALQTASQLFQDRDQWLPLSQRLVILEKIATLMQAQRETLALESAREGGKPLIDSLVEVDRAIDGIKICIETVRTDAGDVIPMKLNAGSANRVAFTQYEPIGVVLAVSAFNHPVNLIIHQVAPAIAAGCPVIVKPASTTPLSCLRLVNIFREAGLPDAWCQAVVVNKTALAGKMVADERLGFFSFIGSAGVGWKLRSQLAPGVRCAFEHGGVAPVIMQADADIDAAIPLLTKGGFYHAGQVCVSVQRVFAHASIAEDVAQALAQQAKGLSVGDPTNAKTEVGPLIKPQETDRIAAWVDEAVQAGATLLSGGNKISDSCYECTVLLNPPMDTTISRNEVFGPVVCVYSYDTLDDAIEQANDLPFAFQAAVFGNTLDDLMRSYQRLNASAVMINDHTAFRVDWMPFAGLRHSGLGVGGIPHTLRDMQIEKMLVMRSTQFC